MHDCEYNIQLNKGKLYEDAIVANDKGVFKEVRFRIDTGADQTVISENSMKAAGFVKGRGQFMVEGHKSFMIASGEFIQLPCVKLKRIIVFGHSLYEWEVVVGSHNVNLLGMDVLVYFDMNVSQSHKKLFVKMAKNKQIN
ncbi:MAG: retroviral-like aspartic protease family protein [Peptococcaceae bacterium]|jgi:predicted aspartyl protease|nr:retroviral-like aspartic protease family protein [Peptococcaceae bacterium]